MHSPGEPDRPDTSPTPERTPPASPAARADASSPPARTVMRADLEAVMRRAIELSLSDADAQERLSEQDLVRIGEELGLPARSVWQALYERPSLSVPAIAGERWLGSPVVTASRVIRGDIALARRRLEDYLVTQEYLSVARRATDELRLIPAEDTISSVARVFARPRRRHHLAHARRVVVATRALPGEEAAVRIEMDLSEQRKEHRSGAIALGVLGGIGGFGLGALAGDVMVAGAAGEIAAVIGGAVAAVPAAWASFAGWAKRFGHKRAEAQLELDALLDRLETGERLEPPPAPWRRRLGLRLFGTGK